MTDSERAELRDFIKRVWDQMGGVGTLSEVRSHCRASMPEHLSAYLIDEGISKVVGEVWRSRNQAGLPSALAVDTHGTHKQLELMDVSEYRYAIASRMKQSAAFRRQAQKLAAYCLEIHGVVISLADPFADIA